MYKNTPISQFTFKSLAEYMGCSKGFLMTQIAKHPTLKKLRQKIGKRRLLMRTEVELIFEVLDYNELVEDFRNGNNNYEKNGNKKAEEQEVLPPSKAE